MAAAGLAEPRRTRRRGNRLAEGQLADATGSSRFGDFAGNDLLCKSLALGTARTGRTLALNLQLHHVLPGCVAANMVNGSHPMVSCGRVENGRASLSDRFANPVTRSREIG